MIYFFKTKGPNYFSSHTPRDCTLHIFYYYFLLFSQFFVQKEGIIYVLLYKDSVSFMLNHYFVVIQ